MRLFDYMRELADAMHLLGIDSHAPGEPFKLISNGELKRWIERGVVEVNGEISKDWNSTLSFPLKSLVLFPSNQQRRSTIL